MKIEHWKHNRVGPDGAVYDLLGKITGHVEIEPGISMSKDVGGCGLEKCKCSEGHWLMINFGRDIGEKSVSGVTVWFDNWGEMQIFLTTRSL